MLIQITMLALLCLFYIIYFAKAILLKKQGISVDLLGKGDKPKKAVIIEIILKSVTYIGTVIQFISAGFPMLIKSIEMPFFVRIIGCVLTAIGVIFFAISVVTMRNNWRAGFSENQNTSLVTSGIYRFSRNPAFLGFDLLYIGCAAAFPNMVMLAFAVIAVIAFHIQILGEEKFLTSKFGQEYITYKTKIRRYL
jgi:protein-S-isoprenylcysteine O-methyltransferase Ste14